MLDGRPDDEANRVKENAEDEPGPARADDEVPKCLAGAGGQAAHLVERGLHPDGVEARQRKGGRERNPGGENNPGVEEGIAPRAIRLHRGPEGLRGEERTLPRLEEPVPPTYGRAPLPGRVLPDGHAWPEASRTARATWPAPAGAGALGRSAREGRHVHLLPAVGAELEPAAVGGEDRSAARTPGLHEASPRTRGETTGAPLAGARLMGVGGAWCVRPGQE